LSLSGTVSTFAGSGARGQINGAGSVASFNFPYALTSDGTSLYVADSSNLVIRKVSLSSGAVTTFAGSGFNGSQDGVGTAASFSGIWGITTDGTNLYVADYGNNEIRQISIATGLVSTLAGSTSGGAQDGVGIDARFNTPMGIATDGVNLFVADTINNTIRKIVIATGVVTTLAGSTTPGSSDGLGSSAQFRSPRGIATDGRFVYVADTSNSTIRKIDSTGNVTTLAGNGLLDHVDAIGNSASFYFPWGIATDGVNLYVADPGNNDIRKIVISSAAVTTLAGSTSVGNLNGTGTSASFYNPSGVVINGNALYVADSYNQEIRMIQ
jgi:hypothetical protein